MGVAEICYGSSTLFVATGLKMTEAQVLDDTVTLFPSLRSLRPAHGAGITGTAAVDGLEASLFPQDYLDRLAQLDLDRRAHRVEAYLSVRNIECGQPCENFAFLRSLEACIEALEEPSRRCLKLVPKAKYHELGLPITHFIRSRDIRGVTSLNMLLLARSLQRSGRPYLGDALELRKEEILLHAIALSRTRKPMGLVEYFLRLLNASNLELGMCAPAWHRPTQTYPYDLAQHRRSLVWRPVARPSRAPYLRVVTD